MELIIVAASGRHVPTSCFRAVMKEFQSLPPVLVPRSLCGIILLHSCGKDAVGAARSVQQAQVLQGSDSDSDSDGPVYGGRSDDEGV